MPAILGEEEVYDRTVGHIMAGRGFVGDLFNLAKPLIKKGAEQAVQKAIEGARDKAGEAAGKVVQAGAERLAKKIKGGSLANLQEVADEDNIPDVADAT